MKKSKICATVLAMSLCAPLPFLFTGCGKNPINVSAKDVYAVSAFSGATYLNSNSKGVKVNSYNNLHLRANPRPDIINDADETTIKNCLSMFDDILQGGEISQSTKKNTENEEYAKYNFNMTISIPNVSGSVDTFTMYYDELNTKTETEIEDDQEEVEVSTTLEGVMLMNNQKYYVEGERNFETEGDESEATIEFTTYADAYTADGNLKENLNDLDSVTVSQSVENDEIEYEYTIKKGGKVIQETELEMETEKDDFEIEFSVKSLDSNKTKFVAKKGKDKNTFIITYKKDSKTGTFNVSKVDDDYVINY